jgi:hypothetical protein
VDSVAGFWLQFGAGAEARFGAFGAFLEASYGLDFYSQDYAGQSYSSTYGAFNIGLGGKYHF